jgi:hypothetical protein
MKALPITVALLAGHVLAGTSSAGYVLHEWGTFTSVFGSDGTMLAGLQREEESLPAFVHAHDGMKIGPGGIPPGKGWKRPLRNVTVKMETPVIYFYSEEKFEGEVEIGFKGGSISQWFPGRQGGENPPPRPLPNIDENGGVVPPPAEAGMIDFGDGKYDGRIRWAFEIMPPGRHWEGKVFRRGENLTWLRPRQTAANVIRVGEEYEKYLFYRGVGNFEMPVGFRVDSDEVLHVTNSGAHVLPYALVYERSEDGTTGFHELRDGIGPGRTVSISPDKLAPSDAEKDAGPDWLSPGPVYERMVEGLLASGLRRDEADAMVQTWWASYFDAPGLRVFWVVPRAETDRVLPMTIKPEPSELIRVLVGRSEVLRPRFEQQLVEEFKEGNDGPWAVRRMDRFGQAYAERVRVLLDASVAEVDASGDRSARDPG